jgi:hypothetical protein
MEKMADSCLGEVRISRQGEVVGAVTPSTGSFLEASSASRKLPVSIQPDCHRFRCEDTVREPTLTGKCFIPSTPAGTSRPPGAS